MKNMLHYLVAAGLFSAGCLHAEDAAFRVRAIALEPSGAMAAGLAAGAWKVRSGGQDATVVSVRTPQEMGARPMKWVIVTLPVQGAGLRQVAVLAIAKFLETLPATDQVLLVNRGKTGLECLTPGFTARPSLWAKGLERLVDEFGGRLDGTVVPFKLPPSPAAEAEEPMAPVTAFLRAQEKREMARRTEDTKSRRSVLDDYAPQILSGVTHMATETIGELARLAQAVAAAPGEKEVLLVSNNEIDDLSNPIWQSAARRSGATGGTKPAYGAFTAEAENNDLLQVQMMMTEMTVARAQLKDAFAKEGLILHTVARKGLGYDGAFGETAAATGGYAFPLAEGLGQRIPQVLGIWPQAYELTLQAPGTRRPSSLEVKTDRKDLKIIAPTLR